MKEFKVWLEAAGSREIGEINGEMMKLLRDAVKDVDAGDRQHVMTVLSNAGYAGELNGAHSSAVKRIARGEIDVSPDLKARAEKIAARISALPPREDRW